MTDITNLQSEVKQLATLAQQLDPYVKRLTSKPNNNEMADLKSLLDRLSSLQQSQRYLFNFFYISIFDKTNVINKSYL